MSDFQGLEGSIAGDKVVALEGSRLEQKGAALCGPDSEAFSVDWYLRTREWQFDEQALWEKSAAVRGGQQVGMRSWTVQTKQGQYVVVAPAPGWRKSTPPPIGPAHCSRPVQSARKSEFFQEARLPLSKWISPCKKSPSWPLTTFTGPSSLYATGAVGPPVWWANFANSRSRTRRLWSSMWGTWPEITRSRGSAGLAPIPELFNRARGRRDDPGDHQFEDPRAIIRAFGRASSSLSKPKSFAPTSNTMTTESPFRALSPLRSSGLLATLSVSSDW